MLRLEFWLCLLAFLLCSLLLAFVEPPWLWAETYTVTALGPAARGVDRSHPAPAGASTVTLEAVAEDGTVVGSVSTSTQTRAAILYPVQQFLGDFGPDTNSFALGAAGSGPTLVVVGLANQPGPDALAHAFVWRAADGVFTDLSRAFQTGTAQAVTASGLIVGATSTGMGEKPTVWVNGTPQVLPTLGGLVADLTAATGWGLVVGRSELAGEARVTHATLWLWHTPVDLTPDLAQTGSAAFAVNATGVTVGAARFPTGTHAFRWSFLCGVQDLGTLVGDRISLARGVNDAGTIVGSSLGSGDVIALEGWRWTFADGMQDLTSLVSTPGWVIYAARAINNAGQILAYGTSENLDQAVLLTPDTPPVPSPPLSCPAP